MNDAVSFIISNIGKLVRYLFTAPAFETFSKSFAVFPCCQYLLQWLYAVSPIFKHWSRMIFDSTSSWAFAMLAMCCEWSVAKGFPPGFCHQWLLCHIFHLARLWITRTHDVLHIHHHHCLSRTIHEESFTSFPIIGPLKPHFPFDLYVWQ